MALSRVVAVLVLCVCAGVVSASAGGDGASVEGHAQGPGPEEAAGDGPASSKLRVIVDVDPSGLVDLGMDLDDDLALLALLGSAARDVELLGVTVTFGNTFRASAVQNAVSVLHIAGRPDVKVYAGSDWWFAPAARWVDGDVESGSSDGAGDADGGSSSSSRGLTPAAAFIVDTVTSMPPGTVTLIALGPLTNVADAFAASAEVAPRLKQLVVMGGDMRVNSWFDIDLNFILSDRHAAARVFHAPADASPPRVVVVPIQTCTQVAFTQEEVDQLAACCPHSAGCQHLAKLSKAVADSPPVINEMFRGPGYDRLRSPRATGGFFPWDLVALMAVLRPDLFSEWTPHGVHVHLWQSEFTRCDDREGTGPCVGAGATADDTSSPATDTVSVTVPMRVLDERALLRDVVGRICMVEHAEPSLIGTRDLIIRSNRRFFKALGVTAAAVLLGLPCVCGLWCLRRRRSKR